MPHDCITDPKHLLRELDAFGNRLKERRRFERRELAWTATVELRGQRFEGMITDLSAGGARIKFDAAVSKGDELRLVLRQLNELGAKVVWQRQGEAGLSFILAPEEVAARLRGKTLTVMPRPKATAPAKPSLATKRQRMALAALGMTILALLGAGSLVLGVPAAGAPRPTALALHGGAGDPHDCSTLLGKVTRSTNQIDFSLSVASAAQDKCLDLQHLDRAGNDLSGHMTQATKVPLR